MEGDEGKESTDSAENGTKSTIVSEEDEELDSLLESMEIFSGIHIY